MGRDITLARRASLRDVGAKDYDALLALAREKAPDPSVFDTRQVAFWGAEISNNTLDSYFTSMSEGFLKQQVSYLNDGISYQDSHNWFQLGEGQSIAGEYFVDEDRKVDEIGETYRGVIGTFFTLRDLTLNGRNTNELIDAMRAGVTRDVSIGFSTDDTTCSICNRQMFEIDWDNPEESCPHIPGFRYGDDKRLAWGAVNSGRLNETSGVFDGSNLTTQINFVIQKAEELMEERGPLDDKLIRSLENRYQTRVRVPQKVYSVGETKMGVRANAGANKIRLTDEQIETLKGFGYEGDLSVDDLGEALLFLYAENQSLKDELDSMQGTSDDSSDEELSAELEEMRKALDESTVVIEDSTKIISELQDKLESTEAESRAMAPYVEMGKKYRSALIEEALTAGVRAQGNDFKKDAWERVLNGMEIDAIELTRNTFMSDFEKSHKPLPPVTRGLPSDDTREESPRKASRRAGYRG